MPVSDGGVYAQNHEIGYCRANEAVAKFVDFNVIPQWRTFGLCLRIRGRPWGVVWHYGRVTVSYAEEQGKVFRINVVESYDAVGFGEALLRCRFEIARVFRQDAPMYHECLVFSNNLD